MTGPRLQHGKVILGEVGGPVVAVSSLHLKTASKGWEGREGKRGREEGRAGRLISQKEGSARLPSPLW